jgi:hypothetical protein
MNAPETENLPPRSLFPPPTDCRTRWVGERCCVMQDGDLRAVVIGGAPLLRFEAGSRADELVAAALIVESGAARVGTVLEALKLDDATLWRAREKLRAEGVVGLIAAQRGPKGPSKLKPALRRRIVELRRKGLSPGEIAKRLMVSPGSVRRVLKREGEEGEPNPPESAPLPFESPAAPAGVAPSETLLSGEPASPVESTPSAATSGETAGPAGSSEAEPTLPAQVVALAPAAEKALGTESGAGADAPAASQAAPAVPSGTSGEHPRPPRPETPDLAALYATLGLSREGEADVVFESRANVPFAGVLLALPALAATGLLAASREVYRGLRRAVYGLRATILVLVALAFVRRPRPEALKGTDPEALGDVLGLLRAPEVKTLRRKLAEIGRLGKAHELVRALATRWLRQPKDELGVLYVDGHVRVYHGRRKLPKAHVTQKNLCLPATTDYWVNDLNGSPVFVVTAAANKAMTKVLPDLLQEISLLWGGRKGTVVFDRGGWSPELFKNLIGQGWRILTYRKGKRRKHPRRGFRTHSGLIDGRKVSYRLSQRRIRLRNGLKLREIAEWRDDGGQTILVTNDFRHAALLLADRMFERWRQENYFRYMKENFALDALVDYQVEPDDPTREVPNPARKALEQELAEARASLTELERAYGAAAAANQESRRPTMRGFKIANGKTGAALQAARERVDRLKRRRGRLPKRVAIGEVLGADQVVRLSPERKLFTDAIKAATYRAETTLFRLLQAHFKKAEEEGRAFLRTAVQQPGDLIVSGDELRVRLAPMSAPRYTAALRALCENLNALDPRFPETDYRLRYEVADRLGS